MSATLYGLGIGPGDPDLITLKAHAILQRVPVVAYPAPCEGDSLARAIAGPHLPGGQIEIPIRMPMLAARFPAQEIYAAAADEIAGHLDAGREVAALCEGDAFFYGSFSFLFARLAGSHPVQVVPGVSSLTACAASLGAPLATRNDVMSVLPAPLDDDALSRRIAAADAFAIIKVGRHFARVRALLASLKLIDRARYVEHATMADQRILDLNAVDPGSVPYFSMILVHRRGDAWR